MSKSITNDINVLLDYIGSVDPEHANMNEVLKKCGEIVENNFSVLNRDEHTYSHYDNGNDGQTYWLDGLNRIDVGTSHENGGAGWLYEASVSYTDAISNKTFNLISSSSYRDKQNGYIIDGTENRELLGTITAHADLKPSKENMMQAISKIGSVMDRETLGMFANYAAQNGIELSKENFVQFISKNINVYPLLSDEMKHDGDVLNAVVDKMIGNASAEYFNLKDEYDFSPTGGPEYMPKDTGELYFDTLASEAQSIGLDKVLTEIEIEKLSYTRLKKNGYGSAVEDFVKEYKQDLNFVSKKQSYIESFTEAKALVDKCSNESVAIGVKVDSLKDKTKELGYEQGSLESLLEEAKSVKFSWVERNITKKDAVQENDQIISKLSTRLDKVNSDIKKTETEIQRLDDLSEKVLDPGRNAYNLLQQYEHDYGATTVESLKSCIQGTEKYVKDKAEVYEHYVQLTAPVSTLEQSIEKDIQSLVAADYATVLPESSDYQKLPDTLKANQKIKDLFVLKGYTECNLANKIDDFLYNQDSRISSALSGLSLPELLQKDYIVTYLTSHGEEYVKYQVLTDKLDSLVNNLSQQRDVGQRISVEAGKVNPLSVEQPESHGKVNYVGGSADGGDDYVIDYNKAESKLPQQSDNLGNCTYEELCNTEKSLYYLSENNMDSADDIIYNLDKKGIKCCSYDHEDQIIIAVGMKDKEQAVQIADECRNITAGIKL
jgi:hypothetical protein